MNIFIIGAGAIGSLIGAYLSKSNNVTLIGRKEHVDYINKFGLSIKGKTNLKLYIPSYIDYKDINNTPKLIIITVKSYDTDETIKDIKPLIQKNTILMSFQNGLGNVEIIEKYIERKNILVGITSHGAFFKRPGLINHTGFGWTKIGELNGMSTKRLKEIVDIFNDAGIKTTLNKNIIKETWIKAIINSSINPLTSIFNCKNGYLLKNTILEKLTKNICFESTKIANSEGLYLTSKQLCKATKAVITNTSNNFSSMLQSKMQGKRTEIDSINGYLVRTGKKNGCKTLLNSILVYLIKNGL
jgi:2-dehydropantoate 2-reductase